MKGLESVLKCPVCESEKISTVEGFPAGVIYCEDCKVLRYLEDALTNGVSVMKKN